MGGAVLKLTLFLMVWNTSHLLARTLHTLQVQTMKDWELLIIDDNSEDDVQKVIRENRGQLPIYYHRLEHDMGMRGNTFSLNYGLEQARGDVVMWSTPEVMLPPTALELSYNLHMDHPDESLWITVPSHGLTAELQLKIDEVDWQSDLSNIKELVTEYSPDDWNSIWFHLNFHPHGDVREPTKESLNQKYSNNQTVSVLRERFLRTIGTFPDFADYGSDDPWIAKERRAHGYRDVTLWDQEAYHQWHATPQYWMALGKAPNWNARGHSIVNVTEDSRVPDGGSCEIWDGGDKTPMTEEEIGLSLLQHEMVIATGFRPKEE
jgi:glycosyltransferase involved in cell wall biosynthesis